MVAVFWCKRDGQFIPFVEDRKTIWIFLCLICTMQYNENNGFHFLKSLSQNSREISTDVYYPFCYYLRSCLATNIFPEYFFPLSLHYNNWSDGRVFALGCWFKKFVTIKINCAYNLTRRTVYAILVRSNNLNGTNRIVDFY